MLLIPRALESLAIRARRHEYAARQVLEDWMIETHGEAIAEWLRDGDWFLWPNDDEEAFEVLVQEHASTSYPVVGLSDLTTHGFRSCTRWGGELHAEATFQRYSCRSRRATPHVWWNELHEVSGALGLDQLTTPYREPGDVTQAEMLAAGFGMHVMAEPLSFRAAVDDSGYTLQQPVHIPAATGNPEWDLDPVPETRLENAPPQWEDGARPPQPTHVEYEPEPVFQQVIDARFPLRRRWR